MEKSPGRGNYTERPRINAVDRHPQRAQIIAMLLAGAGSRYVAKSVSPPINKDVVQRYKNDVIRPIVEKTKEEAEILNGATFTPASVEGFARTSMEKPEVTMADANPGGYELIVQPQNDVPKPSLGVFRDRVEKTYHRIERLLDEAEQKKLLGLMAPLLNQSHKNLEIMGRATGELEPEGGTGAFSIQIICPANSPDARARVSYASEETIEAGYAKIGVIQKP